MAGILEISTSEQSTLTPLQQERYNYLVPFFGEDALMIVRLLSVRGKNSWKSVQEKINRILHADYQQKEYIDSLYGAFDLEAEYTIENIIQNVSSVRSDMKLSSYSDRIKVQSEMDFLSVFIVEDIFAPDSTEHSFRKKITGYKPVFRLKPE
jgi:hypothetical protein